MTSQNILRSFQVSTLLFWKAVSTYYSGPQGLVLTIWDRRTLGNAAISQVRGAGRNPMATASPFAGKHSRQSVLDSLLDLCRRKPLRHVFWSQCPASPQGRDDFRNSFQGAGTEPGEYLSASAYLLQRRAWLPILCCLQYSKTRILEATKLSAP